MKSAAIPRGLDATNPSNWPAIAQLVSAHEIAVMTAEHGTRVSWISTPGKAAPSDVMVTQVPGLALVALAADCVPIALSGDGAVAVVHAGWRGTQQGVVSAALAEICATEAVIGPSICGSCYEVSAELVEEFRIAAPEAVVDDRHLDLAGHAQSVLTGAGVQVTRIRQCTKHDSGWYSFRGGDAAARGGIVAVL